MIWRKIATSKVGNQGQRIIGVSIKRFAEIKPGKIPNVLCENISSICLEMITKAFGENLNGLHIQER